MKIITAIIASATLLASLSCAQPSPPASATAKVEGKTITIKYSAPSVRGRKIFGDGGLVSKEPTYPVWRAGANNATALHTDADLMIGSLAVPAGDYTLFVDVKNPDQWTLIVSKKTGEWGIPYPAGSDLGRTPMKNSKPGSLVEVLKWDIAASGNKGTITLTWENHSASVDFTAK